LGVKGLVVVVVVVVETLIDQERHLALEMPISEMAHVGRERGKHTCKTTTRQSCAKSRSLLSSFSILIIIIKF
jgi:hypothetical protein